MADKPKKNHEVSQKKKKRQNFIAVEKMEPRKVERDPSQSEGPRKSQFAAALRASDQERNL